MDFNTWLQLHPTEDVPAAMAQWLSNQTGETTLGEQVNGDGLVIATPDED